MISYLCCKQIIFWYQKFKFFQCTPTCLTKLLFSFEPCNVFNTFYVIYMYLYDWTICREMDFLSRQHSCFNLHSCASSLGSLSRLVCTWFFVEFKVGSSNSVWKLFLIPLFIYLYLSNFDYFVVQVQSLPRMIIIDEIGKQVLYRLSVDLFLRLFSGEIGLLTLDSFTNN